MMMQPTLRKAALVAHVTVSVGWLGAVAGFLVLAVVGLTSHDVQLVRAMYLAMEVIAFFAILPLAFLALLSGVVSSLGTKWGLFRYYWVVMKLLITVLSTIILVVHLQAIRYLAGLAATTTLSSVHFSLQLQMAVASAATLVVLLVLTALSVYKPQGLTPYGWRKQHEQRTASLAPPASRS
jgi:hypothetical protein